MTVLFIFYIISAPCRLRQIQKREWENLLEGKSATVFWSTTKALYHKMNSLQDISIAGTEIFP